MQRYMFSTMSIMIFENVNFLNVKIRPKNELDRGVTCSIGISAWLGTFDNSLMDNID